MDGRATRTGTDLRKREDVPLGETGSPVASQTSPEVAREPVGQIILRHCGELDVKSGAETFCLPTLYLREQICR